MIDSSCRLSLPTIHTAIVARCHASCCATSLTETLKRERRRSFRLRTALRLSFSDRAQGTISSMVSKDTNKAGSSMVAEAREKSDCRNSVQD